jgi:DNA-binding NarL/FixJ family response regulator
MKPGRNRNARAGKPPAPVRAGGPENGGPRTIRIVLADGHTILRQGVRRLLEAEPDFEVIGEAGEGSAAVRMARELRPDVVVLAVSLAGLNGIDAARRIVASWPPPRVICLSAHREARMVCAMLQAGASGYLLKTNAARELAEAIRTVMAGGTALCPEIARLVVNHGVRGHGRPHKGVFSRLSLRQREVLQLIAEGHRVKEISGRLRLSVSTVHTHRQNILDKLGLDGDVALVKYALREGLVAL